MHLNSKFGFSAFRRAMLGLLLMVGGLGLPASANETNEVTHKVRMYWDFGEVEVELYGEDSPRHAANFLQYVDAEAYDFTYSHRTQAGSLRFIQGGSFYYPSPFSPGSMTFYPVNPEFGQIKNEFDASNGLSNTPGTLAAARQSGLDTASSGWFFNVTDNAAGFDAGPYTVFGNVSSGWDDFSLLPYQPVASQVFGNAVSSTVATAPMVNFGNGTSPNWEPPIFYRWVRIPLVDGDFNLDGIVTTADQVVWQQGQGGFDDANLTADANGDRKVDATDLAIMLANLGNGSLNDLVGDFNANGVVNDADFLWWQTTWGSEQTLDADGNGDGLVDSADYTLWRDHLGATAGSAALTVVGSVVPEPATVSMLLLMAAGWAVYRRR